MSQSVSPRRESSARGKLLLVAVRLNPPDGHSCVAAWALQALSKDWDVTVLCSIRPDIAALNRHFHTQLDEREFRFRQLPWPLRHIGKLDPHPYSIQPAAWLMRMCRLIGRNYEVIMALNIEMDFGKPGIQYVNYPYLHNLKDATDAIRNSTRWKRVAAFFRGRYRPWMIISGFSFKNMMKNLTLTNSHWTANVINGLYKMEAEVLYPPVSWSRPAVPWPQRKVNFVSLGRIHPDKRQLDAIDIVEGVRHRGHDAGLYLVGDAGGDEYAEKVRLRAKAAGPWVRLCHDISRDELEDLLSANRYGLHTMHNEHFGIAVAEFVRAGCIVFVHDSGGPVEIVGNERSLRYDSPEDAVERICRVLESDAEQDRLRTRLDQQSAVFSEENFTRDIRKIVKSFAASR